MAQQQPTWWKAVEAVEELEEMKNRHRADGEVTVEEHERERRHLRVVVLAAVVETAECVQIGQSVMRNGPEAPWAQRLMADRAKRQANVVDFSGAWHDEPDDDGPAAMKRAA